AFTAVFTRCRISNWILIVRVNPWFVNKAKRDYLRKSVKSLRLLWKIIIAAGGLRQIFSGII
ncbi:MAG: hypothetical protein ACYS71_06120, partial [Planctomycetota bacterium]